jgi:GDPmannose 4,6-dehydratase
MTVMRTAHGKARRALVVGARGQDGSYLCEHLASLGYVIFAAGRGEVVGSQKPQAFDILDSRAVADLLGREGFDEVYYLAAHHHSSQDTPESLERLIGSSFDVHCRGLLNVLDAISKASQQTRLFYAASSLVFGEPAAAPQNEETPLAPVCAYGITKTAGIGLCRLYRREKNVHACAGILYNHESPRRAARFVTRKIVKAACEIQRNRELTLPLGDLEAQVDWSFAGDVVRAMHAVLQLDEPDDFVVASGTLHSVRDFADRAFGLLGLDYRNHVVQTADLLQRKVRKTPLLGDASRLRSATGWGPKTSFEELVDLMVKSQMTMGGSHA